MRKLVLAAWTAGLLLGLAGKASAQESPVTVIERAIKAHGGLEQLARARADRVKIKGTVLEGGREMTFSGETLVQLPGQLRNTMQIADDKKTILVQQVVNGKEAWVAVNGQPQKLEANVLAGLHETMFLTRAVRLVPLLRDRTYDLSLGSESKVNDRPCTTVKVAVKGHKDLILSFDKETGLLVKTEHFLTDPNGKDVKQEEFFSDFKEVEGYKRPMKIAYHRDGKKIIEAEITEVKYYDKIDEREFGKP
jgi:hypothetical protein